MWPNGKYIRMFQYIESTLTRLLGKALDVRLPLSKVMIIINIRYSTNQDIHGSIPCTFNLIFAPHFFGTRDKSTTPYPKAIYYCWQAPNRTSYQAIVVNSWIWIIHRNSGSRRCVKNLATGQGSVAYNLTSVELQYTGQWEKCIQQYGKYSA